MALHTLAAYPETRTHDRPSPNVVHPVGDMQSAGPSPDDLQAKRDEAWAAYKDRISNAWRLPGPGPRIAGASASWTGSGS